LRNADFGFEDAKCFLNPQFEIRIPK